MAAATNEQRVANSLKNIANAIRGMTATTGSIKLENMATRIYGIVGDPTNEEIFGYVEDFLKFQGAHFLKRKNMTSAWSSGDWSVYNSELNAATYDFVVQTSNFKGVAPWNYMSYLESGTTCHAVVSDDAWILYNMDDDKILNPTVKVEKADQARITQNGFPLMTVGLALNYYPYTNTHWSNTILHAHEYENLFNSTTFFQMPDSEHPDLNWIELIGTPHGFLPVSNNSFAKDGVYNQGVFVYGKVRSVHHPNVYWDSRDMSYAFFTIQDHDGYYDDIFCKIPIDPQTSRSDLSLEVGEDVLAVARPLDIKILPSFANTWRSS